jgi:hypothetical protein
VVECSRCRRLLRGLLSLPFLFNIGGTKEEDDTGRRRRWPRWWRRERVDDDIPVDDNDVGLSFSKAAWDENDDDDDDDDDEAIDIIIA